MSTAFTWGFPEQGMGDVVPQDVGVILQDELRKSQTTSFLTPQSASPTAQNATGLGIQNVKRGFATRSTTDGNTVYAPSQISNTDWKELYPSVLSVDVACSGRPVMVFIRGQFLHTESPVNPGLLEARVDGSSKPFSVPCSASDNGAAVAIGAVGVAVVSAGNHTFSVWTKSGSPSNPGTYIDGSLGYYLTVVEI